MSHCSVSLGASLCSRGRILILHTLTYNPLRSKFSEAIKQNNITSMESKMTERFQQLLAAATQCYQSRASRSPPIPELTGIQPQRHPEETFEMSCDTVPTKDARSSSTHHSLQTSEDLVEEGPISTYGVHNSIDSLRHELEEVAALEARFLDDDEWYMQDQHVVLERRLDNLNAELRSLDKLKTMNDAYYEVRSRSDQIKAQYVKYRLKHDYLQMQLDDAKLDRRDLIDQLTLTHANDRDGMREASGTFHEIQAHFRTLEKSHKPLKEHYDAAEKEACELEDRVHLGWGVLDLEMEATAGELVALRSDYRELLKKHGVLELQYEIAQQSVAQLELMLAAAQSTMKTVQERCKRGLVAIGATALMVVLMM